VEIADLYKCAAKKQKAAVSTERQANGRLLKPGDVDQVAKQEKNDGTGKFATHHATKVFKKEQPKKIVNIY